jgi:hypothetical protein
VTFEVTNPREWELVSRANYGKPVEESSESEAFRRPGVLKSYPHEDTT